MGNLPQKRDFYPRKGKLCLTKEHFTPQKGGFFLRERVFYITKVDFSLRKSNFYLRKKQFPPQEGERLYIRKWKLYLSHWRGFYIIKVFFTLGRILPHKRFFLSEERWILPLKWGVYLKKGTCFTAWKTVLPQERTFHLEAADFASEM